MKWNRIALKLGVTIIALFLVVLLSLGFVMDQISSGFYYKKMQNETNGLSARFVEMMGSHGSVMVNMIGMMAEFSKVDLYIVDSEGNIVSASGILNRNKDTLVTHEDIVALAHGLSVEKEIKVSSGDTYFVSAKPLMDQSRFNGGVYVLSSMEDFMQSVHQAHQFIFLSGVGAFFLALGITYIVSRKLSQPLIQMEYAARRIATGDLNVRVSVSSEDEMGSLAQAINDLAQELQRYRDTRSEFFANISHELRTPITYLEGYTKVLSDELYDTEEEKRKYLDVIRQEAVRLKHLVQDLFELSKMEEGKFELYLEWIDLSEVIESSIEKVQLKAKEKGIRIQTYVPSNPPLVYGDGMRMEQIFFNLLDNAVRYTEKGTVSVGMNIVDEHIVVSILDTGMGIPNDELAYIFERFYRVEKSRSRQYGGTGLGLAIVKMLVEIQGGTIGVTSEVGKGTRFQLGFRHSVINPEHGEGEI